jgi:hypothetical protein
MKTKILATVLVAAALGELAASAQTLNYNPGDLLAAFRKAGSPDLVVDLGSISQYQQAAANGSGTYTFNLGADLTSTFGSLDSIYWTVFACDKTGTYAPAKTLWMSDPRSDVNVQNDPPTTSTSSAQTMVIGQLGAIADALSATYGTIIDNQVIQLPSDLGSFTSGDPASYTTALGTGLDFNGTYSQNFENISSSSAASVSDLFQENPSSIQNPGTGTELGTVTLDNTGKLTVQAVPEPSVWALLGSGLIGLVAFRRMQKEINKQQPE